MKKENSLPTGSDSVWSKQFVQINENHDAGLSVNIKHWVAFSLKSVYSNAFLMQTRRFLLAKFQHISVVTWYISNRDKATALWIV